VKPSLTNLANLAAIPAAAATLFVNMQSGDGRFKIGRYDGRSPSPVGAVAVGSGLWSPSAIKARGVRWLFAGESAGATWKSVVLYTSTDDGRSFLRRGEVFRDERGVLTPTIVYDEQRDEFHLWYSRDLSGAGWASEIVHATSESGLSFTAEGVRFRAGVSTGPLAPAHAFRDGASWTLLVHDYTGAGYSAATPHVLSFADPRQPAYVYGGRMTVEREAGVPKIDASYVCRRADGSWWGLFTEWGAPSPRWAWEWTVVETAPNLLGPWTIDRSQPSPYLPFENGGTMISVENPAALDTSADLDRC
jgi:hypothetical protein